MNKLALIAALLATSPAVAATIEEAKAKPAKSTMVIAKDRPTVVRCLRLTFDGATFNEIDNPDGTTDITTSVMGHRYAVWTLKPGEGGLVVEGRGQFGGAKFARVIAGCASPA